jgi:hypothetical protein
MSIIKENSKLIILGLLIASSLALMGMSDVPQYHYEIKHVDSPERTGFYFFRINEKTGEIQAYAYESKKSNTAHWYAIEEILSKGKEMFNYGVRH